MRVDMKALKTKRLERIQQEMKSRGIGGLLLTNPVHIRYATDVAVMSAWTSVNLARYAFVPVEGEPTLFEYSKALFRAEEMWPRTSRIARTWQYRFSQHEAVARAKRWADDIVQLLKDGAGERAPLGVDVLDFYGMEALRNTGLRLVDADESMQAARLIKLPEEITLLEQSLAVAESSLAAVEAAIKPGVSEQELLGVFYHKMMALGGEHCSTRLLAAGSRTNPWFNEAGDYLVRPMDLVAMDTDMSGPEGYLCDISRTYLCGDTPTTKQRDLYRFARDFVLATAELCTPGRSYRDIIEKAPAVPVDLQKQAYSCMIHGVGVDDEPPFLPYAHALKELGGSVPPDGHLQENMILSVEFYAGRVGEKDGVKLEDQILITAQGPKLMSRYSPSDPLY